MTAVALAFWFVSASAGAQPTIPASVVANGGARVAGPANRLQSTVGQAAIGYVTGVANRHGAGFWYRERGSLTTVEHASPAVVVEPFLGPGSPNPFNPRTTMEFATATSGRVKVCLYDLAGRQVNVLVDEELPAGRHEVVCDAKGLSSGIYICRMTAGAFTQTRKLTLVK